MTVYVRDVMALNVPYNFEELLAKQRADLYWMGIHSLKF